MADDDPSAGGIRARLRQKWTEVRSPAAPYFAGATTFAGTWTKNVGLWPGRDFGELFALRPQNTIAVKVSYWMSR